jgi:hypothetical protein
LNLNTNDGRGPSPFKPLDAGPTPPPFPL